MKFARYLEETQTPEWKKAYIDYRGLKKRITAIKRAQGAAHVNSSASHNTPSLLPIPLEPPPSTHDIDSHSQSAISQVFADTEEHTLAHDSIHSLDVHPAPLRRRRSMVPSLVQRSSIASSHTHAPQTSSHTPHIRHTDSRRFWMPDGNPPPLMVLLPQLAPVQRAFFDLLDAELDKVESFFCAREREVRARAELLTEQLQELKDHRRIFHEAHPHILIRNPWFSLPLSFPSSLTRPFPRLYHRRPPTPPASPPHSSRKRRREPSCDTRPDNGKSALDADSMPSPLSPSSTEDGLKDVDKPAVADVERVRSVARVDPGVAECTRPRQHVRVHAHESVEDEREGRGDADPAALAAHLDPEEYRHAKKKLKKAALECYRGLEVLNNYRTLNLIGFRKALKKFEKVTSIPAQQAYTVEKIEPSAFSSGVGVDGMLREMEDLYSARFTRGDKKRAMARLRGGTQHKSHHFSTFRTGAMIGLAVPAFIDGVFKSFEQDTRAAIPGFDGLLFVYGVFLIPVIFSLLVGLNVLVWSNARINYIFIFELDVRTRLDHREYFEVPSIILCTLCYAFWLSFSRIGAQSVDPTTWPLFWLALTALVMFDPLPILFKPSRWWLARNVGRLLTSGVRSVEFADFWMGDQFCSLIFTLANLVFVGCTYTRGMDSWESCTSGHYWGPQFALATLPLLVRVVQSIKRWVDSRLITHLINGGKYASGIIYYLCYYLWREHGGARGPSFVVWCIFGTNYSIYASAWDLLMDWSLLRPHARHPLLRSELLYSEYIPLYYLAMISNIMIRFIWVIYIPNDGPSYVVRTFIAGMLEMLRRWQWNFIRLENEHLGNVDQYRVTREVPLPYSFDDPSHDSDGDEDDGDERASLTSGLSWRRGQRPAPKTTSVDVDE